MTENDLIINLTKRIESLEEKMKLINLPTICDECVHFVPRSKPSGSIEYPNQIYYYHICKVSGKTVIYSDPICTDFGAK